MKIAIMQLASWGDVIISTCIPKLIKQQRPNDHITFYTSSVCEGAVQNNPDIDKLIVKKVKNRGEAFDVWGHVTKKAKTEDYDKIITPWAGVLPEKDWRLKKNHNGHNNFMWSYPRAAQTLGLKFEGTIKTYLYPTDQEKQKITNYINNLDTDNAKLIMMEIQGNSCQTHWNPSWTKEAVRLLKQKITKFHLFISHGGEKPEYIKELQQTCKGKQQIHYMNNFSLREMSVLFNHCHIMFSVSSGTANACMTHQCKKNIKWFELVNDKKWDSTPMGAKSKYIYRQNNMKEYFKIVSTQI